MQFPENQGAAHPIPSLFITFLAASSPPWDDLTEACDHGSFSDKLDKDLDAAHVSCALCWSGNAW